ncbi:hypothetical protein Dimus_017551 [Dionaea muscipula]
MWDGGNFCKTSEKHNRSRSHFGFVRFGIEEAAGLAVLKIEGLKLQGRFLHMKKAAFGRDALGSYSGMAAHPPVVCEARMVGGQTGTWRGSTGDLEVHSGNTGGGHFMSYKATLQRGKREDTERVCIDPPSNIVILGHQDETMDGGHGDEAKAQGVAPVLRSRSHFGFVRFGIEEAVGLAVLKIEGLKLQGRFLYVKKAAFARDA